MSRRSHASLSSFTHEKRFSKFRVTDEDLFNYALRVAVLTHLLLLKESSKQPSNDNREREREREREHLLRLSSLSHFSIGDLFKDFRDGSKSVKFPEKLLKVLEQKLQDIAMGKNATYSDQLVRRTMAKFYGQFMDESFKRQMKENRKIEELILMFATHATTVLKKEPTLANDGWKTELDNHIAQFVKMLGECLRGMNHVSPELLSRLDSYVAKLTPSTSSSYSDSGYDSASTSRDRSDSYLSLSTATVGAAPSGLNVADMHLVRTVANLFKIPEQAIQSEVDQLKGIITEKAAITDLKTCLKNINAGAIFPGRREDFEGDAGWQHWRSLETIQLQQLMVDMVQANPELAKTTSDSTPSPSSGTARHGSIHGIETPIERTSSKHGSISARRSIHHAMEFNEADDTDDDLKVGHHFTFIPPIPRRYYKRLVELCLQDDLDRMLSPEVPDNEEVSLGILSQPHLDLLSECALRWRIGPAYRAVCFLDLVKQFFERDSIPVQCVDEALGGIVKAVEDSEVEHLMIQDYDYLCNIYAGLFTVFMSQLYHSMDQLPSLKLADIEPFVTILDHVTDSGLLDKFNMDIAARYDDIRDHAKQVIAAWYDAKLDAIIKSGNHGVNRALPLLTITDEVEKNQKLLKKRFAEPLLGQLDLVSLFVQVVVPHFINDLSGSQKKLYESSMNGPTPDVPIQDIFALYGRTKMLIEMHRTFCPNVDLQFDLGMFFEPYVRQWLVTTDNRTSQWVEAAIAADKFEAEGSEGHSSSIVDLFDSLRSPINFLQELEWAEAYQEARFFTSLAKTISKAVDMYCRTVENLFLSEMFPRPNDYIQPPKSSAWLEKARQLAVTGEKRVEPFNFRPETCVKLNNIEGARKLLDNMYNQVQADRVAEVVEHSAPPVPEKVDRGDRFLFTVKIVIAEGLVPVDGSASTKLDTFVTLSDEAGNRLAKTRTIYESVNPRWEEAFDISVEKPLWLMLSVRDRALVGKHDTVGRAYLCLDPRRFGDFLSHELWMDLDTHGRVLVRVSMEGEKDDILFFFGRAFRSLKKAEGDMLRVFIDKMSPFIQQCLSRNIVKTLIKSREAGLDYNKALGNVTAFYKSALGGGSSSSEVQIPPAQFEKPRVRPDELTDVEVEQAIVPLFDYFDANLQTLNTHLSETAKMMVMTRVWKEVLSIVESLLIPPLSEVGSDMKPLSDKEVDIVFKWLKFLRDYFYAGGEGPVPLEAIQNQRYRDVLSIRLYYDWHTDELMEECVKIMQQSLGANSTFVKKRAKSVYSQRNLGTIRERKKERKQEKEVAGSEEIILRILRMRPGTSDFITQQIQIMTKMQQEQEKRAKDVEQRKLKRPSQMQRHSQIPAVPPLPGVGQ
ncbi:hypothetical protein AX15_007148 [Amanita polypyramis BW_CC]|nr:hypothetical protein AX15_007148 [Amanita polypyramis BW_CC]